MNRRRPKEKLRSGAMDAVVAGIAPAFIVGMIACLLFFLVLAFYRGEYDVRVMYILGLFTIGTVFIARIAIESGRAHANLFSFPLAMVAAIAMWRFVSISGPLSGISGVVNIGFLGLAWYLADRITFDCTWISERDPSHRQGLLQSLGLLRKPNAPTELRGGNKRASAAVEHGKTKRYKKHNPGVWVLYFALLAFPLFGLGQLAIPQPEQRQTALVFLAGYLGCALALLVTTSFLGMRRYLRQRGLEMPAEMNRTWLTTGIVGLLLVLIASLILPLPNGQSGVTLLPIEWVAPEGLTTSRFGWGQEGEQQSANAEAAKAESEQGPQNGPARENAQGNPDPQSDSENGKSQGQQANRQQAGRQQAGDQQPAGNQQRASSEQPESNANRGKPDEPSESKAGEAPSNAGKQQDADQQDGRQGDAKQGDAKQNAGGPHAASKPNATNQGEAQKDATVDQQNQENSQPQTATQNNSSWNQFSPSLPTNLAAWFKWVLIGLLVLVVLFYALRNPSEIARLWRSLLEALAGLFGGNRRPAAIDSSGAKTSLEAQPGRAVGRAFQTFRNPFADSAQLSPEQAVQYTFAALEAWAREQGVDRGENQTAAEFASTLARRTPQLGTHPQIAASMFDRTVFAKWKPQPADLAPLERLWQQLR